MADELRGAQAPKEGRSQWPHEWYSYEGYQTVYLSHMGDLIKEGVVLENGLSLEEVRHRNQLVQVRLHGRVQCARDVVVAVDKILSVRRNRRGQIEVKGVEYSYHAFIKDEGRQLLRYDCHGAGGVDNLHKHVFDPKMNKELSVEPIDLSELPALDGFIREAVAMAP